MICLRREGDTTDIRLDWGLGLKSRLLSIELNIYWGWKRTSRLLLSNIGKGYALEMCSNFSLSWKRRFAHLVDTICWNRILRRIHLMMRSIHQLRAGHRVSQKARR